MMILNHKISSCARKVSYVDRSIDWLFFGVFVVMCLAVVAFLAITVL